MPPSFGAGLVSRGGEREGTGFPGSALGEPAAALLGEPPPTGRNCAKTACCGANFVVVLPPEVVGPALTVRGGALKPSFTAVLSAIAVAKVE